MQGTLLVDTRAVVLLEEHCSPGEVEHNLFGLEDKDLFELDPESLNH